MKAIPATEEAYQLLHDGSLALARVEEAGIRIDLKRLNSTYKRMGTKIKFLRKDLFKTKVGKEWKREFGDSFSEGNRQQLITVLHKMGKVKNLSVNENTGNVKADKSVLEEIDDPFVKDYLLLEKLKKVRNTFLKNFLSEVTPDGYLHPMFGLNVPITYRSSCERPNAQNIPNRDASSAAVIRKCIIPRKDHVLLEFDFKGAEVCLAACYNHDPVLISYVKDSTKDMHRDMACEIFMVDKELITKQLRHISKNQFVFPQFYGSVYQNCAPAIWKSVKDLSFDSGVKVIDFLKSKGIKELGDCNFEGVPSKGTFEKHLRDVEHSFWKERFSVYDKWKGRWWRKYLRTGTVQYYTGFVIRGLYTKKEVINYPIQGTAFHCLLWCLIEMVRELRKMKSKVIAQIHDSMWMDVHKKELDDVIALAKEIMTERITKHWNWLIVPLSVEAEIGENNIFEKRSLEI